MVFVQCRRHILQLIFVEKHSLPFKLREPFIQLFGVQILALDKLHTQHSAQGHCTGLNFGGEVIDRDPQVWPAVRNAAQNKPETAT